MATHDYVLANQSGSSFRTDLNNALAAVVSNNSNSSEPSTTYAFMLWVDTTNNLVKLRNSANNAWITLFTTAGGLDVDAASNFNEDVTFTGASANVTWDKSADDLIFNDNAKAVFGTSSDGLELFHGSSQSWIKDVGTGNLVIDTDGTQVSITSGGAAKTCARFIKDEGVKLSYDDTIRFETTSTGVTTSGKFKQIEAGETTLTIGSSNASGCWLILDGDSNGDGAGGDYAAIGQDSSGNLTIQSRNPAGTGNILLKVAGTETGALWTANGSTDLYYDNSKKIESTSVGAQLTGRLNIGTSTEGHSDADDLTIETSSGYTGITLRSATDGGGAIYFSDATSGAGEYDGQVLYSQNSQTMVLATAGVSRVNVKSTGIEVAGKVIAEVTGTSTVAATFINSGSTADGTEVQIQNKTGTPADNDQTGYLQFQGNDSGGNMTIFNAIISTMDDVTDGDEDGSFYFYCRNGGGFSQQLKIAANGTFTGSSSNDISDQRLKENIATVVDPITKIKALKGRTFTWKPEAHLPEGTKYGFIAQEVESVVSDLVDNKNGIRQFDKDDNLIPQDEKAKVNMDEGTTEAKSINALGVVPILVEALKEALTKIETLETKVAALEAA